MINLITGLPNGLLAVVTDEDEVYLQESAVGAGGRIIKRWVRQSTEGLPTPRAKEHDR